MTATPNKAPEPTRIAKKPTATTHGRQAPSGEDVLRIQAFLARTD